MSADDDAQFAFESDFSGIALRSADRLTGTDERRARLDQEQRMGRRRLAELYAQRREVIPQGDDFGGHARTLQRTGCALDAASGAMRRSEDIAVVLADVRSFRNTEADPAVAVAKADP
jgi:hypothetical protein